MSAHRDAVNAIAVRVGDGLPFHRYSDYLMKRYGQKTYRVSVDAGFTCPVRESGDPCTYCDVRGSRAPYLGSAEDLSRQIRDARLFLERRYAATNFLLYFQAFSNTYADASRLREVYDTGLSCGTFCGLIVSTRPDCIDESRADLLAEYASPDFDVWVELGLQSGNEKTLQRVHRGHGVAQFDDAVTVLRSRGILVAAHVILGLPGEGRDDAVATSRHLARQGVDAVKFHNLVVVEGTRLYDEYLSDNETPPGAIQYMDMLVAALENIPPEMIVMRLTCDPPHDLSSLPADQPDKARFYSDLVSTMQGRKTWQGRALDKELRQTVP